ncbi:tetratricopeptide repeat protein [Kribbella sp. NPDC050124]|uniref:tetratricopeptide repeat protein n=1 Tax=Kribbella sp. NPDC050124 TaxID=3364114 RepID=UPI003791DBF9
MYAKVPGFVADNAILCAGIVTLLLVGLACWHLEARRHESDFWAGITAGLLMIFVLALPAWLAFWEQTLSPAVFWWTFGLIALAFWIAATEWLRRALRVAALFAVAAMSILLLNIGQPDASSSWTTAIQQGADKVTSAALKLLPGLTTPNKWLYILIGVSVLGLWRLVERTSNSEVAGPAHVSFTGAERTKSADSKDTNDPDKAAQEALFTTALSKNLREPGSTPGATPASTLTDLEEIGTVEPTKILKAIVTALRNTLNAPRGSNVHAQVLTPLDGRQSWRVWVRVADTSTGRSVSSKEVTGDSLAAACGAAGYWAAATILSDSSRIPVWARWSPSTAEAFSQYDTAVEPSEADLREALEKAPASGLILHKLGDTLAMRGNSAPALELYARAVAIDPTHQTATYRLAATLAALSHDSEDWSHLPQSSRHRLIASVNQACGQIGIKPTLTNAAKPDDLKRIAFKVFNYLQRDLKIGITLRTYLRRDQREAIGPLRSVLSAYGDRRRTRFMVRAAALTVYARDRGRMTRLLLRIQKADLQTRDKRHKRIAEKKEEREVRRVEAFAAKPRSGWQTCYNLACYFALNKREQVAIYWLERMITRPGIEQLAGKWISRDQDLVSLHGLPRFTHIVQSISKTTEKV